jgi:hypothetical protein
MYNRGVYKGWGMYKGGSMHKNWVCVKVKYV